jgi:hypothetical protein
VGVATGGRAHRFLPHEQTHAAQIHENDVFSRRIDTIAAYAPDTDRCYLIPVGEVEGHAMISLRAAPTRNNQAQLVR